jgi:hypothetical protein
VPNCDSGECTVCFAARLAILVGCTCFTMLLKSTCGIMANFATKDPRCRGQVRSVREKSSAPARWHRHDARANRAAKQTAPTLALRLWAACLRKLTRTNLKKTNSYPPSTCKKPNENTNDAENNDLSLMRSAVLFTITDHPWCICLFNSPLPTGGYVSLRILRYENATFTPSPRWWSLPVCIVGVVATELGYLGANFDFVM